MTVAAGFAGPRPRGPPSSGLGCSVAVYASQPWASSRSSLKVPASTVRYSHLSAIGGSYDARRGFTHVLPLHPSFPTPARDRLRVRPQGGSMRGATGRRMRWAVGVVGLLALVLAAVALGAGPAAAPAPATAVGSAAATVGGSVDPNGQATTWWVEF